MYPIIGISGKYGAGKDTVAEIIRDLYPEYVHERFSANVKKVTAIITGTTEEEQYTREGKDTIPEGMEHTIAYYQQKIGGGIRELIDDEVWVRSVLNKKEKMVITDTRYKSEVRAIEARGGIVLRIERPNCSDEFCQGRDPNHSSEIDLDDWPFENVIINDGDLALLRTKVVRFFAGLSIAVTDEKKPVEGEKMTYKWIDEDFRGTFHKAFTYVMDTPGEIIESKDYLNEFLAKGSITFTVSKADGSDFNIYLRSHLQ